MKFFSLFLFANIVPNVIGTDSVSTNNHLVFFKRDMPPKEWDIDAVFYRSVNFWKIFLFSRFFVGSKYRDNGGYFEVWECKNMVLVIMAKFFPIFGGYLLVDWVVRNELQFISLRIFHQEEGCEIGKKHLRQKSVYLRSKRLCY